MDNAKLLFRGAFVVLLGVTTYASVGSPPSDDSSGVELARMLAALIFGDPDQADKIGHFAFYAALGALARLASFFPGRFWAAPVLLAAYGALLEIVQYFLSGRSADVIDGLANASGALTGFAGAAAILAFASRRRT